MRFYPRNRKSRHDAMLGPNHIDRHPRGGGSLSERDRSHRYDRGNDGVVTPSGALASTTALTFNAGGTFVLTVTGDDRFKFDAVTARSALLISAFAAVTNLTLTAGAFSLSADGLVLTVTVPVNTTGAGSYDLSFDKMVFEWAHDTVAVVAAIVLT